MDILNAQWEAIAPFFDAPKKAGRPCKHDSRNILNGILWILRTGAPWKDLPKRYPPYQTVHRWFQKWRKSGIFDEILLKLATDLKERGKIDLRECFIDGTFASAKKGVLPLVKLSAVKALKSWQLQIVLAFLSPYTQQARHHMKLHW